MSDGITKLDTRGVSLETARNICVSSGRRTGGCANSAEYAVSPPFCLGLALGYGFRSCHFLREWGLVLSSIDMGWLWYNFWGVRLRENGIEVK